MTKAVSILLPLLLYLPQAGYAVLLDCEITAARVYHCVELNAAAAQNPQAAGDTAPSDDEYLHFVEQARSHCVYEEPRRRAGGKKTSVSLRTEIVKSAREKYERCVDAKARELWRAHHQQ